MKRILLGAYNASATTASHVLPTAVIMAGIALTALWIAAISYVPLFLLWSMADSILYAMIGG
jgi:hypothetical protein